MLPSVCSQCAIFLFTVVDGIFVGRGVGTDALGAVNLALPYMMVLSAFYMLTTIGGVTITAIRIGSGDIDGANQAFMHALTINLLFSVLFLVLSFGIVALHFVQKRGVLRVSTFRFEGALVKKVLLRGSPEMLSQLTTPIMTLCMNAMVMKHLGSNGINAYSVISYVTSLAFAVILGVAEGMQQLFGQSYGERNAPDLKYYYRAGWSFALIGSLILYALAIATGRGICELFGADAAATKTAVLALPKYGWLFLFAALNTLIAAYLYSTRRTKESMLVNALRAFVFIPACVMGVTTLSSGALLWSAVGAAEALSFLSATGIVHHSERNGLVFRSE